MTDTAENQLRKTEDHPSVNAIDALRRAANLDCDSESIALTAAT